LHLHLSNCYLIQYASCYTESKKGATYGSKNNGCIAKNAADS
jgi:hypothetical protein